MGLIEQIEAENMKESVPAFNVGDTVKVGYRIIEGGKERIQNFEGVVIAKKNGGIRETFTVRRLSFGVGVERCFPLAGLREKPPRSRKRSNFPQNEKKSDPLKVRSGSAFLFARPCAAGAVGKKFAFFPKNCAENRLQSARYRLE